MSQTDTILLSVTLGGAALLSLLAVIIGLAVYNAGAGWFGVAVQRSGIDFKFWWWRQLMALLSRPLMLSNIAASQLWRIYKPKIRPLSNARTSKRLHGKVTVCVRYW